MKAIHAGSCRTLFVSTLCIITCIDSFTIVQRHASTTTATRFLAHSPSRVTDFDGPTPEIVSDEPQLVDPEDVPGLAQVMREADLPRPIPHQPWRRGETAGCEAPIAAQWRREAEEIIYQAVEVVGGKVLDVTWFLTAVLVTIDDEQLPDREEMVAKDSGPVIKIKDPRPTEYKDPADPEPEEIWGDEEDVLYQRETAEEREEAAQMERNKYATQDPDDPNDNNEEPHIADSTPGDEVPLYMNEESRDEVAVKVTDDEQLRDDESQQPIDIETIMIDPSALSVLADAILKSLEDREDDLEILSRHELILTSPGPPDVIETQKQFDAYRDEPVMVETQDPFESNRTLKGRLVDRNAMDVVINQQGRMVTIPLNFVKCVRLPTSRADMEGMDEEEANLTP